MWSTDGICVQIPQKSMLLARIAATTSSERQQQEQSNDKQWQSSGITALSLVLAGSHLAALDTLRGAIILRIINSSVGGQETMSHPALTPSKGTLTKPSTDPNIRA